MEDKVKLRLMGITFNQIQAGAYALILGEEDGQLRIPVVIGAAEAQAIAAKLENATLPRPLIYDIFQTMTHAFGISVREVFISKFSKGVFYAELTITDGEREVVLDSRTSDAIAIAVRTGTPIYTTREVLKKTGFVMDGTEVRPAKDQKQSDDSRLTVENVPLERLAVVELEKMMQNCISKEKYEEAAKIKKIIDRKTRTNEETHQD